MPLANDSGSPARQLTIVVLTLIEAADNLAAADAHLAQENVAPRRLSPNVYGRVLLDFPSPLWHRLVGRFS